MSVSLHDAMQSEMHMRQSVFVSRMLALLYVWKCRAADRQSALVGQGD